MNHYPLIVAGGGCAGFCAAVAAARMGVRTALIEKYRAQGGTVLSLEPHLYEFVGLQALEQEGEKSVVGAMSFKTSEEAFDYAAHTLKKILEGMQ